jgi:hypothetical protein
MNNMIKLAFCTVSCYLFLAQTVLANGTELAVKIQACSEIHNNEARLTCFDELTNKKNNAKELPSVTALPAAVVLPAATGLTNQQVDSFSKQHVKKSEEEIASEINSITLTVSKVSKTAYDKLNITFANGQKWQQKDNKRLKLTAGDKVTLTKGALSSVYLKKDDNSKRIKVKRLK